MSRFRLSGFTLTELLIVVSIIAILATILVSSNFMTMFKKARDSNRKQDLVKLAKIMEDYYNDKQRYPPMNTPSDGRIYGSPWGGPFLPYVESLPKDPLAPNRDYFYQGSDASAAVQFFVIYAKLEMTDDPDITTVGCTDGCGPADYTGKKLYNYQASSPNVVLTEGLPFGFSAGSDINPGVPSPSPILPTSTAAPTPTLSPTPTPTFNPLPPADPNTPCSHLQCCRDRWCIELIPWPAGKGSVSNCNQSEICIMQSEPYNYGACTDPANLIPPQPACP